MKRTDAKRNGVQVIVEEYKNFIEFTDVQNSRKATSWAKKHGLCRNTNDPSWRKCESFEEAQDYLIHGYDEDVESMIRKVHTLQKQGVTSHTERFSDVTGYAPIVPNAILGLPNSMMNSRKKPVKNKVVTILYNPSISAASTKEEVLDYGAKMLSYVANLEKHGYRVRIEYCSSFQNMDDKLYVLRVPIKSEFNPINIKRVAFPMAHVGMFRYLTFDWYEHLPKSKHMDCYGFCFDYVNDKVKDAFYELLDCNEYLIVYGWDLDKVFEQVA